MKPRKRVSKAGIELIKRFEGLRRTAARLPDGRWTMGYGHVKFAREGAELTEKDAEALLIYDLIEVAGAVNDLTFTPLSQNQFDALVSFAFNIGIDQFRASAVLRRVNEADFTKAAFALEAWRSADFGGEPIVVDALVRRRAAEKALFLTPDEGFVAAPSPVVPPKVDYAAEIRPPLQAPASVIAPLEGADAVAHRAAAPVSIVTDEPEPSPLTATVDVVAERLRTLVPDEIPEAAPAAEAAPQPEPAHAEDVEPFPALTPAADADDASVADWREKELKKSALPIVAAALAGAAAFGFAVFQKLAAGEAMGHRASDQAVMLISGIIGVVLLFWAAIMGLNRYAGVDD